MIKANIPKNEDQRLGELYRYQILDTLPEDEFEQITQLVTRMLNVPIALVSLVDKDRQWFKAKCGLHSSESSRDVSFCAHVVFSEEPLVIPDTHQDERFSDNPLVTEAPFIRCYLGVPLITQRGFTLGTLCAIDTRPREFSEAQVELMVQLSDLVIKQLDLRLQNLELNQQKERLSLIFNQLQSGVIICDTEGEITELNHYAKDCLGASQGNLLSKHLERLSLVDQSGEKISGRFIPNEVSRRTGKESPQQIYKCADHELWFMLKSYPLKPSLDHPLSTWPTLTHLTEVTQMMNSQKTAELLKAKLIEQDRWATIGTLAAGVGHEINNPLSYIYANTDYMQELLNDRVETTVDVEHKACDEELIELLSELREGAERIGKIVSSLNTFARSSGVIEAVKIGELIDLSLQMIHSSTRSLATITVEGDRSLWVKGEKGRLSQIFINLILNAVQSFERPHPQQNSIKIKIIELGSQVQISIQDNGPGIEPSLRALVFNPFFTTKEVGEGTGLGLSISKQHIESMGGSITLKSFCRGELSSSDHSDWPLGQDSGTELCILLISAKPLQDELSSVEPRESDTPLDPKLDTPSDLKPSSKPRLLIIDDDQRLLSALQRLFGPHYELTICADPLSVLELFKTVAPFDLILSDVMMPHMNGLELYQALCKLDHEVAKRFVFITGGVTQSSLHTELKSTQRPILNKPLDLEETLKILKRVMRESAKE